MAGEQKTVETVVNTRQWFVDKYSTDAAFRTSLAEFVEMGPPMMDDTEIGIFGWDQPPEGSPVDDLRKHAATLWREAAVKEKEALWAMRKKETAC